MITIRKANKSDFSSIIEIMKSSASREELKGFIPPKTLESRIKGISSKFSEDLKRQLNLDNHGIIIAEENETPVGFAYFIYQRDYVEIEEMDITKDHQRQGIGKALLHNIEIRAKEKGAKYLKTGTSINNQGKPWKAYGFWRHMGFIDTGKKIRSFGLQYTELIKSL